MKIECIKNKATNRLFQAHAELDYKQLCKKYKIPLEPSERTPEEKVFLTSLCFLQDMGLDPEDYFTLDKLGKNKALGYKLYGWEFVEWLANSWVANKQLPTWKRSKRDGGECELAFDHICDTARAKASKKDPKNYVPVEKCFMSLKGKVHAPTKLEKLFTMGFVPKDKKFYRMAAHMVNPVETYERLVKAGVKFPKDFVAAVKKF